MLDSSRRLRMDGRKRSDSLDFGCTELGSKPEPFVADVRRDTPVADASCRSPDDVEQRNDPPSGCQVVTYCFHGHELGQGMAAAFRIMGIDAPLP
jgi:hypothetical protein